MLMITVAAIALLFRVAERKYSAVVRNNTKNIIMEQWICKSDNHAVIPLHKEHTDSIEALTLYLVITFDVLFEISQVVLEFSNYSLISPILHQGEKE